MIINQNNFWNGFDSVFRIILLSYELKLAKLIPYSNLKLLNNN